MVFNLQFLMSYLMMDAFCIVLTFIISANVLRDSGSETQVRYFYLLLTTYMVFLVSDLIWAFVMFSGLFPNGRIALVVLNGLNKVAVAFTGYFWFCYAMARFDSPFAYNWRARLLAAIPVALVPVVYVIGFIFDLNIVNMGEGITKNGPTYLIISAIALLYLVAATFYSVRGYRKAETTAQRRTFLVFVSFMIAPSVGAVFDAVVPNTPVMAPCMMVSILLVFMSLQESRISIDALTGLNNRRRADAYLEDCLARIEEGGSLRLFIIDMDKFKSINDTYGHLEGDRALKVMAATLKRACAQLNAFAARWGGDEFVVVCADDVTENSTEIVELVNELLREEVAAAKLPYSLSCSVGYAEYSGPGETIDRITARADQALYAIKRQAYAQA